ncbi:MAG: ribonuclease HII [Chloroflexota bacterium]
MPIGVFHWESLLTMDCAPTFSFEERLWQEGYNYIAGIDEVGRGALAGPVVAGAVILPKAASHSLQWLDVRDSKLLSPEERTVSAQWIQQNAVSWAVGEMPASTIDEVNIAVATRQAMKQAVENLSTRPDYLLIDWVKLPSINLPQESPVKADMHIVSVAAASILAKVYRDQRMVDLGIHFPSYGFAQNKGYGTKSHRLALETFGPCIEHRHSFSPIAKKRTLFES